MPPTSIDLWPPAGRHWETSVQSLVSARINVKGITETRVGRKCFEWRVRGAIMHRPSGILDPLIKSRRGFCWRRFASHLKDLAD